MPDILFSRNISARVMRITHLPAITQAITRLESQLGLPLFERNPAGMMPTEAAAALSPRIEVALAHIASPRVTMAEMRALIALADTVSYVGASAVTGLAQPTLHRAIRDLSVVLGRALVERRGRGFALTGAGRQVARAFYLARAELDAGLSEIERLKGRETGRIAIGAMPLSRARLLPAAVTAFLRERPGATIEIVEGSHGELIEPLRDGNLDVLVGALRGGGLGDDVVERPLFEDCPVILGRKGHPLDGKRAGSVGIGDLLRYPWTISAPGAPLRTQWEAMFVAAGVDPPAVPVVCGSALTIRQILLDSDFLTLLSPDQVAVELEAGWLAKIGVAPRDMRRTIGTTRRAQWRPTAMQQAFVTLLKEMASQG